MATLINAKFVDVDSPVSPGGYPCEISYVTEKSTEQGLVVNVTCTVDDNGTTKQVFDRLQFEHPNKTVRDIARQKTMSYMTATDQGKVVDFVSFLQGKGDFEFQDLIGGQCWINVVASEDGQWRNVDLANGPRPLTAGESFTMPGPDGSDKGRRPNLKKA